jgi:DNA transformation protein and related proteins
MRNFGPKSMQWLAAVGIHTLDDLREVGVITAYNLVTAHGYNTSLNLLWAMQGALMDVHWTKIPESVKQLLKQRLKESA